MQAIIRVPEVTVKLVRGQDRVIRPFLIWQRADGQQAQRISTGREHIKDAARARTYVTEKLAGQVAGIRFQGPE